MRKALGDKPLLRGILLVVLLARPVLGAGQLESGNSVPHASWQISRLPKLVVDGSDDEWVQSIPRIELLQDDAPTPRTADDFKVGVRLAWTAEGLAVLIDWQDDFADEASLPGGIYERDAVELYLAPFPNSPAYFQVLISPGLSESHPEMRHFVYHYTRDESWLRSGAGLQIARQRRAGTAVIEALLPWEAIGLERGRPRPFAFRIYADDADGRSTRWRRTWGSAERDYHWVECAEPASTVVPDFERVKIDERPGLLRAAQHASPPFKADRDFARIDFESYVFAHDKFPEWSFLDPIRTRDRLGMVKVSVRYLDDAGSEVQWAAHPGRYGAILRVESDVTAPFEVFRTLYRLPWNGSRSGERGDEARAIELAEAAHGPLLAPVRNTFWWHRIKQRLGTATRYDRLVEVPRDYASQPEHRWPLLLFLHGSGFGKEALLRAEAPLRYAQASSDYPFVLVQPMTSAPWEPAALADLLDEIEREYRIDPDRIYLAGFSLGGIGTWATAIAMPERFAAIVPVAARGAEPGLASRLSGLPIWAWNGEQDPTTRVEQIQRMIEAVRKLSFAPDDVRLTVVPGLSHPPTPDYVFGRHELYAWLLKHKRRETSDHVH